MIDLTICNFSFKNVQENIALEELMLKDVVSGKMPPVVRTWSNPKCVIMGISRSIREDLNVENILSDKIPIARRITGGGTVYHDDSTMSYSFFFPWEVLSSTADRMRSSTESIKPFLDIIINALGQVGIEGYAQGISDIFVKGKKVSGNAQKRTKGGILHHGTILLKADLNSMERYLRIPKERDGVSHREFVTSLYDLGFRIPKSEFHKILTASLTGLGFKLRDFDLALKYPELLERARQLSKTTYEKNNWIYRRI
ncbi:MAG: lipoate--protein ligase family protein [bacterium]